MVEILDTTLRDGTQGEGVSLSVDDKVAIARRLAAFGIHLIEGGWPGSNPKDAEFFQRMRGVDLGAARLAAFGATRRKGLAPEEDPSVLALLEAEGVELVVLARYMQILSPGFVERFPMRIINIHHSFLPAFAGADPYRQAYERGVKLIGATAHYVTEELDQGPIIEQDVVRVSHRHSVREMKRLGRELERTVLARAVRWHLEDRILVHENRTVVFV